MNKADNACAKEIREWIEKNTQQIIEDLSTICKIRSVADMNAVEYKPYGKGCKDVLDKMLEMGSNEGFEIKNYDDYVGRISYVGSGKDSIGIWSHLDVVDEGTGWDYKPYDPIVKENYFIARGCQDNKSSAIMALYVLKYMKEHNINLEHTLSLYLGTCEEEGMYDLDYYIQHYPCPTLSLVPDSGFPVCCGERGSFNGELAASAAFEQSALLDISCDCGAYTIPDEAKAVFEFSEARYELCQNPPEEIQVKKDKDKIYLQAQGVSTQAANAGKGKNALTLLSRFILDRKLVSKEESGAFELVCDINRKHDGSALNVFTSDVLSGPITLVATQMKLVNQKAVIGFISKFPVTTNDFDYVENATKAAAYHGFTLKVIRFAKANCFEPERAVVKKLTQCCNEVLGREDKPFVMSGGTYARKLPNAFAFGTGMPLPKAPEGLFKPGHGDYHQPDESISMERVKKALEIYILGILAIDKEDVKQ